MADVLDLEGALREQGLRFTGQNEDGTINVIDSRVKDAQPEVLDVNQLLQSENIDPTKISIKFNSPETATDEDAVGFAIGVKMALAKNKEDQIKTLTNEFGEGNVKAVKDGFVVKENGIWKKASGGFFDELIDSVAASSPEIAAGAGGFVLGAKGGAALGTLIFPGIGTAIGAAIGGVLGGAVSSTVAKTAKNEIASKMGIRTESDAAEVQAEMGKEFVNAVIWDTALLGLGKVIKPIAKGSKNFAKRAYDKFFDKVTIAETAEKLIPGTSRTDWRTILRSTDDADAVLKDMDNVIKFKRASAEGLVSPGAVDPSTAKSVEIVQSSLRSFKKRAFEDFEKSMNHLESHGVFNKARVNINDVRDGLSKTMKEAGILDAAGTPLTRKQAQAQGLDITIFDAASRNRMVDIFKSLDNISKRGADVSVRELRRTLTGIDNILEKSGFFSGGDLAIANPARRALKAVRNQVRNKISQSLDNIKIPDLKGSGQQVNAADVFNEANKKYHSFRNTFDDFAILDPRDRKKTIQTVDKMLGKGGFDMERNFGELARSVGRDGENTVRRLQQLRAARNLSDTYAPGLTGKGTIISEQLLGITSPKVAARIAAKQGARLSSLSAAKNTPVSQATITGLKATGTAIDFVRNTPMGRRLELLSNPDALRQIINATEQAPKREEEELQRLRQQGQ